MSIQAVELVQYTKGLTLAEYVVLISLASLANKDDWRCWPSLSELADISNIEKKTAIRAIQRLTAPYIPSDPRPLVSLVENRKMKVRNHTYELNVPLLRELQKKRKNGVTTTRASIRVGVPTTPPTGQAKYDFEGRENAFSISAIAFPGGIGVFELPLPGHQEEWVVTQDFYEKLKLAHPRISIMNELSNARIWLFANTSDRKTAKGLPTFISNWMDKAQNRPRGRSYGNTKQGREEGKEDALEGLVEIVHRQSDEYSGDTDDGT